MTTKLKTLIPGLKMNPSMVFSNISTPNFMKTGGHNAKHALKVRKRG
ncbi:hypothetical protein U27_00625 [Candidatus Vecturithrix granuli]|uniref:Uncharacterized protein n=1 Tax=Vecturithrix granuli TaxID=1499967 RepID=A0A081C822_VECG1|nr:hypothetical protein U27_00625 [Candidatus Vecturithrix granuli]